MVNCQPAIDNRAAFIAEVLSESTSNVDRSDKLVEYSHVLHGGTYMVVHQDRVKVETFRPGTCGEINWLQYHAGDSIDIDGLNAKILVDDIYRDAIERGYIILE